MHRELIDELNVFVIHDFLSAAECHSLILRSEAIGYETFRIDGEIVPDYRTNARVELDDVELAQSLWARAAGHVPSVLEGHTACGLNPRFRLYRYRGSEAFAPHFDGSTRMRNWESKLTFMIYLADVAKGGETRFYSDNVQVRFAIRPELGKALVFNHCLLHEGVAVEEGTKYVLRSDVMFE